jgi:hypothetical protein
MSDREAVARSRQRVAEALDAWNERPGGRPDIQRIGLGFTNHNWRATWQDGTIHFVKSPGEKTGDMIERRTAVDASRKVGDAGVGPRLLQVDPRSGVEIYEFLAGFRNATLIDFYDVDILEGAIAGYRRVHRGETFLTTATGFEQIDAHLDHLRRLAIALPPELTRLQPELDRARASITASGMDLAGCYNDAHITNYMIGRGHAVKIIDWEYASNNDPVWDLGLVAFESFMTPERERLIIELYYGSWTKQIAARVYLYSNLSMVKWALWALLQSHLSSMAYDFRQYAQFLLARVSVGIAHPRWSESLKVV